MATYPQLSAQDLDNVLASTLQDTGPEMRDQTLKAVPALNALTGNKRPTHFSGDRVEQRLAIGRNSDAAWAKTDSPQATLSDQNVATVARFNPAFLYVPTKWNAKEKSRNSSSPQKIFDLVEEKKKRASQSAKWLMASAVFGDGSNNSLVGLDAIVPVTSGSNTYGGISEATAPFWRSQFATTMGSYAANGFMGSADDVPTRMFLNCSDSGAETPNVIISGQDVVEHHHRALGQRVRFIDQGGFGNIGGVGFDFLGAKWVYDRECPTGTMFFLHSDAFYYQVNPDFDYRWTDMMQLGKAFLDTFQVLMIECQITVDRRNLLGRISGITA
jgi:hypothetical protein